MAGYRCMRFIKGLLTRRESKWELLVACGAGLFSLRLCRPASPPPTSTAASDLESVTCPGRSAPSPPPSNDATKETIIEKKIDFKQTIIDF